MHAHAVQDDGNIKINLKHTQINLTLWHATELLKWLCSYRILHNTDAREQ